TEGMVALIDRYRSLLPAPDVVRLLVVLSEMETQLRTSGSPRLAVELLLLRWAMMGRTVELQAVIEALGKKPGTGEEGRGKGDPVTRHQSGARRGHRAAARCARAAGGPIRCGPDPH